MLEDVDEGTVELVSELVEVAEGSFGFWPFCRILTVKLKIPGKAFLKSETRISVTFKL